MTYNNHPPTALITGGSAGLGFTLAGFLAAQGYNLIITGRDAARLETAVIRLRDHGGTVSGIAGDIGDARHRLLLVENIRSTGARLDLLVNNASTLGPLPLPELADYALDALRQVLEINPIAPLALVQELRPVLAASRPSPELVDDSTGSSSLETDSSSPELVEGGLVINISSDAALGGYESWGGYGASKAALDLLSRTLANELRGQGIGVVSVDPGDMRTQMHQNAFAGEDISDRPLPEATIPFWAWLLGQDPAAVSGQRFQAQSEQWTTFDELSGTVRA